MNRSDRESRRMLVEALETVRELRAYLRPKAGVVHRVKVLLRKSGVPIPSPRRPEDTLARAWPEGRDCRGWVPVKCWSTAA